MYEVTILDLAIEAIGGLALFYFIIWINHKRGIYYYLDENGKCKKNDDTKDKLYHYTDNTDHESD